MIEHRKPENLSDFVALSITKFLRLFADTFFAKRYGHRAVVLETVAGVPGMVAGMWIHLKCLRYVFFPRTAHRLVGYFEEEAVISYTGYLEQVERNPELNIAAPQIAIDYWKLKNDARLIDVIKVVREDEKGHSIVNHGLADTLDKDSKKNP